MPDEPMAALVVHRNELLVRADLLLTTPERTGHGLTTLPFLYLPASGDRGPLLAYVPADHAIRWLEYLVSAGCPGCDGDGTVDLLDMLKTRHREHLEGGETHAD
jgi:hypothetical protein